MLWGLPHNITEDEVSIGFVRHVTNLFYFGTVQMCIENSFWNLNKVQFWNLNKGQYVECCKLTFGILCWLPDSWCGRAAGGPTASRHQAGEEKDR